MKKRIILFLAASAACIPSLFPATVTFARIYGQGGNYNSQSGSVARTIKEMYDSQAAAGTKLLSFESSGCGPMRSGTWGFGAYQVGPWSDSGAYRYGVSIVMTNLSFSNGRILADVYQGAYSDPGGGASSYSSYNVCTTAVGAAYGNFPTAVQYDITDLSVTLSIFTSGSGGGCDARLEGQTNPPVTTHPGIRLPSGAVVLSKITQRTDANVLVSASVTNAQEVVISRGTVANPAGIGTVYPSGPTGAKILDSTNMAALSVDQTPGTPGTPDYFYLFAKGIDDGLWYFLGQSALSPYGTLLTLDISTPDSIAVGGVRRLRSEQLFTLILNSSQVSGLLSTVSGTGTEVGDHFFDVQVTQSAIGTKYFKHGPPVALLATADATSGIVKGTQSFIGNASDLAAAVPGVPPVAAMLDFAFTGWTRTITGASGTFAPMCLAGPVELRIYPQSSSSVSGFTDSATGELLASTAVAQGGVATIPGNVTLEGGFGVQIANPYPNSKHFLLLGRPDGSIVTLQTADNTSTEQTTVPVAFAVADSSAFSGDGAYKLYILSQTPTDVGTSLADLGIPAAFSSPPIPGYGWVSDGIVTINYVDSKIEINGAIIRSK